MRSIASILLALSATLSVEAELRFTSPRAFADLGLEMPALADSAPDAVEMPRAESFLVTESTGAKYLEDRYDTFDLWMAQTIRARWRDGNDNLLIVARLAFAPPDDPAGFLSTRADFERRLPSLAINPKDKTTRNTAVLAAAPVDVLEEPVRPRRSRRRTIETLLYYQSTNTAAYVWVFRPTAPERGMKMDWYMAALILSPDENPDSAAAIFDADFLDRIRALPANAARRDAAPYHANRPNRNASNDLMAGRNASKDLMADLRSANEPALLKRDYRRSVINYESWHAAESGDVVVVDDLLPQWHESFVSSLTNDLPQMRAAYAAAVPSPLVATNHIAAVRVFSDREDYLSYIGEGAEWSAAVWSPRRRELVLNLQPSGADELLKTIRHEAFHQYLAYAGAMAEASPWFNEGHAELFERTSFDRDGKVVFERDEAAAAFVRANAASIAASFPALLYFDYMDFYSGTDAQRRANYRIAWSIAYFLEVGAPEVRFRPFASLRADYVKALVQTRNGDAATEAVFNADTLKLFSREWKKFWTK